ncbi:hypothetical protein [Curtobacterium ammoniigenes]|uniref:hypothetical protein n=1 Tax=Curtobacterium ammoniigenes TaxID=395387 RepID=UPI0008308C58|nr:hypothetical protein [Curtobacterium ammoniigenes]
MTTHGVSEPNRRLSSSECWAAIAGGSAARVILDEGAANASVLVAEPAQRLLVVRFDSERVGRSLPAGRSVLIELGAQDMQSGWSVILVAIVRAQAAGGAVELRVASVDGMAFCVRPFTLEIHSAVVDET